VPFFNAFVLSEPLNSGLRNLTSGNKKHYLHRMV